MRTVSVFAWVLSLALWGCEEDDPMPTPMEDAGPRDAGPPPPDTGPEPDTGPTPEMDAGPDAAVPDSGPPDAGPMCMPLATDYTPRVMMSATDTWPACVSDDGTYHPFGMSISSIARVMAFESMMTLLDYDDRSPTMGDFISARDMMEVAEGLGSRIDRRTDEHFMAPAGTRCQDTGVPEMYPDYCAGPSKIRPVLNDAFVAGIGGVTPRVQAARIEAAILWFLAISTYKESLTCTSNVADCDSNFAYYTGGMAPPDGIGLSRYIRELSPEADLRAFDGVLAVRCWRDLDNPTGVAMDTALRDRARAQQDAAVLYGVAQILKDRLRRMRTATGELQQAYFELAQILGGGSIMPPAVTCGRCRGFLEYQAELRSPADAAIIRTELDRTDPTMVDVDAVIAAIDRLFPCP